MLTSEGARTVKVDDIDRAQRYYRLADTFVEVEAPIAVARVLDTTMIRVRSAAAAGHTERVVVRTSPGRYVVEGRHNAAIELPENAVVPAIAGAVTTMMAREVAHSSSAVLIQAVIVERGGRALALAGPGWNAAVTIATHLSVRGWRMLTSRFAFLDAATLDISGLSKLLYIDTEHIPDLPRQYRRALEASPWHSTADGIAFYGVDPLVAEGATAWVEHATLAAALIITDPGKVDAPAIDIVEPDAVAAAFAGTELPLPDESFASLVAGPTLSTVNLVERWFDMIPVPA